MLTETVLESISLRYVSSIVRPSHLPFLIPFAFLFVFGLVVLPGNYADNHYFPTKASASSALSICPL